MPASSLYASTFTSGCGEGTAQPVYPPLDWERKMATSCTNDKAKVTSCSDFRITRASMV